MATLTFPHVPAAAGLLKPIANFVSALIGGVREGREISRRYDALARLIDAELASIGLTRADVPQAAVNGSIAR